MTVAVVVVAVVVVAIGQKGRINQLNWVRSQFKNAKRFVGADSTVWQFKQQNSTNQQWKPQKSDARSRECSAM